MHIVRRDRNFTFGGKFKRKIIEIILRKSYSDIMVGLSVAAKILKIGQVVFEI